MGKYGGKSGEGGYNVCMTAKKIVATVLVLLVQLGAPGALVFAAMTSTNYQIESDTISAGGNELSESASYMLRDTVGGNGSGLSESTSYGLDAGYRSEIYDRSANFSVLLQDSATQTAITALSGNELTVTSQSGYSVGDYVVLVSNLGANQQVAIGKIEALGATMDVDFVSHGITIDGNGDYVYALTGSGVSLGAITAGLVRTAVIGWEVTADTDNGYQVLVYEDEDLTNGAYTLADVADGTVTLGNSEYGGRSTDTTLTTTFDTQDTAFTSSPQQVASQPAGTFYGRDALILKAAASAAQAGGSYSHTLDVIYVGNY